MAFAAFGTCAIVSDDRLTARRTLIDGGTQAGDGPNGAHRLALIGSDGAKHYGVGAGYVGEMVETTSADYANAADGVDNMGYAVDAESSTTKQLNLQHEHRRQQKNAEREQNMRRNVKPVIHFPEPPAVSPSNSRCVYVITT